MSAEVRMAELPSDENVRYV